MSAFLNLCFYRFGQYHDEVALAGAVEFVQSEHSARGALSQLPQPQEALRVGLPVVEQDQRGAGGEGDDASLGIDARSKVEARLRQLEGGSVRASAPNGAPKKLIEVVQSGNGAAGYSAASDMVLSDKKKKKDKKKRDREELSPDEAAAKKARKAEKKARKLAEAAAAGGEGEKPKKKKKKSKD